MSDFAGTTQKIFDSDKNIRGITFARFDGEILHFEMRPGVESLNPPGEIGKMDAEVLVPALSEYFDRHSGYFGHVDYMVTKFEKVSIVYVRHNNIFAIASIEPGIDVYPIVRKIKSVLNGF